MMMPMIDDDDDDKTTKVAVYLATVGGLLQLGVKSLPHNWTAITLPSSSSSSS